jgi:MFS family permease
VGWLTFCAVLRAGPTTQGKPKPDSLGTPFWRLWWASLVSNLGDGVGYIAYPWLASVLTRSPVLVAVIAAVQTLPWLLFSLPAGVIVDRFDRRRIVVAMDFARALLTGGIAVGIIAIGRDLPTAAEAASGSVVGTQWALYLIVVACSLLLGLAEVLRDNSAQTLLPSLVRKEHLERANGRLGVLEPVAGSFIGPPLGGALIGIALFVPIAFDSVTFAVSAALLALLPGTFRPLPQPDQQSDSAIPSWRQDLRTGLSWLMRHPALRLLAVVLAVENLLSMMAVATFILFAQEVIGTSPLTFALMGTGGAVGAIIGGSVAPAVAKKFSVAACVAMAVGGIGLGRLLIGLQISWVGVWVSSVGLVMAILLWNVVTVSYRQRMVPDELLGRVNSAYRFIGWGTMPVGMLAGGVLVALLDGPLSRDMALRAPLLIGGLATVAFALAVRALLIRTLAESRQDPSDPALLPEGSGPSQE